MATASVTYSFVANTLIESAKANTNFNDLVSFINSNLIQKDASVAFTAIPSGPASDPTTANQFARKAYVDAVGAALPHLMGTPSSSTSTSTFGTSTAAISSTGVSATYTYGRKYLFLGMATFGMVGSSNGYILSLYEGGLVSRLDQNNQAVGLGLTANGMWWSNTLAGSHTFSLGIQAVSGTGTLTGSVEPHKLLVLDLGP